MAKVAGDVVMRIGGDNSGFTRVLSDSSSKLDAFRSNIGKGTVALGKFAAAAGVAGGALAVAITRDAAQAGKEIANLSRVSGVSATEFQKLAAAANTVGIEQEKLGDIFKDVRDRVGDFIQTGGGPMADFFERIAPKVGVTAEQFRKLSGPQALQLFVDTMQEAGLSANEVTFQLEAMAGDAALLAPLLKDGGATMREFGDAAERAGQILSDIDVARLQLAAQQMDEFDRTIGTLKNQLGAQLAPVLAGIGKLIEDAAMEAGGFGNLVGDAFNTAIDAAGFVADAIYGIKVAFQTVADAIIIGAGTMAAALTNPFEDMAAVMSMLPGDTGAAFEEIHGQIKNFRDNAKSAVFEAMDAIDQRLMEPLPSEGMKKWVAEVQKDADIAAQSLQERMAEATGGAGLTLFSGEEDQKKADEAAAKLRDQLAGRVEAIRQASLTESEVINEKYAQQSEDLQAALEQKLLTEEEWMNQERLLKERHAADLTDIEAKATAERQRIEEQAARAKLATLQGALSTVSSLMNSENRKMFEVGKAAAIAQSIINTYQGIGEAWKLGPILGPPMAALVGAAGFANVAAIRSQSFGGGGSAGVAGAGTAGLASAQTPGVGIQGQQEQVQRTYISGIDPNQLYDGRTLLRVINDAVSDGGVIAGINA